MSARDIYLKGLVEDAEGRQAEAVDAFVESARLSEDFTPGHNGHSALSWMWVSNAPDVVVGIAFTQPF